MYFKKGIGALVFLLPVLAWVPAEGFMVGGEISFTNTGDLVIHLADEEEFKNSQPPSP